MDKRHRIFQTPFFPAPLHFSVRASRGTPEIGQTNPKGRFTFSMKLFFNFEMGGMGFQCGVSVCPLDILSIYCTYLNVQNENESENKNAMGEDTYAGARSFAPLAQVPPFAFLFSLSFTF